MRRHLPCVRTGSGSVQRRIHALQARIRRGLRKNNFL